MVRAALALGRHSSDLRDLRQLSPLRAQPSERPSSKVLRVLRHVHVFAELDDSADRRHEAARRCDRALLGRRLLLRLWQGHKSEHHGCEMAVGKAGAMQFPEGARALSETMPACQSWAKLGTLIEMYTCLDAYVYVCTCQISQSQALTAVAPLIRRSFPAIAARRKKLQRCTSAA